MRRSFLLFVCLCSFSFAQHLRAQNNVGALVLDSAFVPDPGTPGKIEIDFEGAGSEVTCYFASRFSSHLLAGGKISTGASNTLHFGLIHYDVYGNPWPGFGSNGRVDLSWSGNDYPLQLMVMPDNGVLAAGAFSPTSGAIVSPFRPAVYRIKANGTPDSLFGTDGRLVITDAAVEAGEFTNIDSLRAGGRQRFVAMGHINSTSGTGTVGFYAAWFDSTGSLDPSFGSAGITHVSAPGLVQAKGFRLLDSLHLFAGVLFAGVDSSGNLLLCRVTAAGQPDATFGVNGVENTGVVLRSQPVSTFSFKDLHLYITASLADTSSHVPFALFRFDTAGRLDASYGKNGFVTDPIFSRFTPHGLGVANDGSLLFAGETASDTPGNPSISAAAKFFSSGIVDSSFGINGLNRLDADDGARRNFIIGFVPIGRLTGAMTKNHFAVFGNTLPAASTNNFLLARYTQPTILNQSVGTLHFGGVDTGSSGSESFTITNYDSVSHLIDSASAPGSLVFAVTSPKTATTLAPGQSMTITVSYQPHAVRGDSTQMFVYDHSGLVVIVSLYGVGVADGAFDYDTLNFGQVDTGRSFTKSLTLTNFDTATHILNTSSLNGSPAFAFVPPTASDTLAPGQTAAIILSFNPKIVGGDSAHLSINGRNGLYVVASLYGTGMAVAASVHASGAVPDFVDVSPNPASSEIRFAVSGETIRQLTVLDALGRVVRSSGVSRPSGTSAFVLDVAEMPSGVYFCTVETNAGVHSARFTVAH